MERKNKLQIKSGIILVKNNEASKLFFDIIKQPK